MNEFHSRRKGRGGRERLRGGSRSKEGESGGGGGVRVLGGSSGVRSCATKGVEAWEGVGVVESRASLNKRRKRGFGAGDGVDFNDVLNRFPPAPTSALPSQ